MEGQEGAVHNESKMDQPEEFSFSWDGVYMCLVPDDKSQRLLHKPETSYIQEIEILHGYLEKQHAVGECWVPSRQSPLTAVLDHGMRNERM